MSRAEWETRMGRLRELCLRADPMTPAEEADFESAKARVRAEDELLRQPSPQLDLEQAA